MLHTIYTTLPTDVLFKLGKISFSRCGSDFQLFKPILHSVKEMQAVITTCSWNWQESSMASNIWPVVVKKMQATQIKQAVCVSCFLLSEEGGVQFLRKELCAKRSWLSSLDSWKVIEGMHVNKGCRVSPSALKPEWCLTFQTMAFCKTPEASSKTTSALFPPC